MEALERDPGQIVALKGGDGSHLGGLDLGAQQIFFRLIMIGINLVFLLLYFTDWGERPTIGLDL
jgi:hypothetical protein